MAEGTRQRLAFDRYWALGAERRIEGLRGVLTAEAAPEAKVPALRTLYEWSRRYRWQDRLAQLERDARAESDSARLAALHDMYARQAQEGLLLQQKGAEWLQTVAAAEASPEAGIRALVEGAKLERLARGEPSERAVLEGKEEDDARFAGFSDAELDALVREAERIVARKEPPRSD